MKSVFDRQEQLTLVQEYEAGASVQALADNHYCAKCTVYAALKRGGARMRPKRGHKYSLTNKDREAVLGMVRGGWRNKEIARCYGVSESTLIYWLRRFGLERLVKRE